MPGNAQLGATESLAPWGMKLSPEAPSPLMALPPELRNSIYEYTLLRSGPITVATSSPYIREPSILAVSRKIRDEALTFWYGDNDIVVPGSVLSMNFLRSRSDQQLRAVRSLCIASPSSTDMWQAPAKWENYMVKRVEQLERQFARRGLSIKAIKFQIVNEDGSLKFVNTEQLKGDKAKSTCD